MFLKQQLCLENILSLVKLKCKVAKRIICLPECVAGLAVLDCCCLLLLCYWPQSLLNSGQWESLCHQSPAQDIPPYTADSWSQASHLQDIVSLLRLRDPPDHHLHPGGHHDDQGDGEVIVLQCAGQLWTSRLAGRASSSSVTSTASHHRRGCRRAGPGPDASRRGTGGDHWPSDAAQFIALPHGHGPGLHHHHPAGWQGFRFVCHQST